MMKGFSLIELLVVITIIGIIAAVAVPAYKNYTLTSKLSSIVRTIDNLTNDSILFANKNGRFANAYDLGLSTTPDSPTADDPAALNPYMGGTALDNFPNGLFMSDVSDLDGSQATQCGAVGFVSVNVDPQLLGFSSDVVPNSADIGFSCYLYNINGVINKWCSYYYGTDDVSNTGSLIPGWQNVNTTNAWDYSHYDAHVPLFQSASCL